MRRIEMKIAEEGDTQQQTPAVYYNDIDPYCCAILRRRSTRGALPRGVIDERDIRTIQAEELRQFQHIHLFAGIGGFPLGLSWVNFPTSIRVITGGFPCQDISQAGKRRGIDGERSGLWREMARIVSDLQPQYVLVENVAALLGRGMGRVLGDLSTCGYDAEWQVFPAAAFGAPHRRDRVYIVAYPTGERRHHWFDSQLEGYPYSNADRQDQDHQTRWQETRSQSQQSRDTPQRGGEPAALADANGTRLPSRRQQRKLSASEIEWASAIFEHRGGPWATRSNWWTVEPDVGRVVDGLPNRMDRVRVLGNAIVPQIAAYIGTRILLRERNLREYKNLNGNSK
jgi:DNA (cytosine-5)-methyltransferase 1